MLLTYTYLDTIELRVFKLSFYHENITVVIKWYLTPHYTFYPIQIAVYFSVDTGHFGTASLSV